MRKSFVGVLLIVFMMAAVTGVGAANVLRVGSDVAYAPFEYVDEQTGEFVGFDMDIIREVGRRMGVEVQIDNVSWEGIIPGLLAGHYDVIISAMTITDERAQAVDFSDPYFATGQVIVVRADDDTVNAPADLAGKVVAVQIGTTGQFAAEGIEGAKVEHYPLTPDAFLALRLGRADAAVVDEMTAIEEQLANPGVLKVVGTPFTIEYYGIAMRKGRQDLLRAVNRALAQIKADGTYDEIYDRWFGAN